MKRPCEREAEVARAARTGFWTPDLRRHAGSCTACAETLAVTTLLLEDSAQMRAALLPPPPNAADAWLEARRRARLHLHRRALFWFRALRTLALLYLPAMLLWSFSQATPRQAWKPALQPSLDSSFRAGFAALSSGPAPVFALSGVLLAALCIFMGAWYLLREARTPLHQ